MAARMGLLIFGIGIAMAMCGCMPVEPVAMSKSARTPMSQSASQDRLPARPVTATSPVADDSRLVCEGERHMICNQQWIGDDEKCRRMTCERIAGLWVLRDPHYAAPISDN